MLGGVILFNLSFIPLFFIMFPRILGLPNGKQPINLYLTSIKANWLKPLNKILLVASICMLAIFITYPISEDLIQIDDAFISLLLTSSLFFWQELLFRGIILTMLLRTKKKLTAIILNACVFLLFYLVPRFIFVPFYPSDLLSIILFSLPIFLIHIILAFLCVKTNNILPGIIVQIFLGYI